MTARDSLLGAMTWARELPHESLEWLKRHVEEIAFDPQQPIISQGDTDRDCYFLVSGHVVVVVGDLEVGSSGPGEPIGESGLLYREPRLASVIASGPVRTLLLRAGDFDELASSNAETAQTIATALMDHLALRFGRQPPPWTPADS